MCHATFAESLYSLHSTNLNTLQSLPCRAGTLSAGTGGMALLRRRNQRGFSLIVVFLIIVVMAAVAAGVMSATQGDLQVSGYDRESAVAFYAAEAGVAYAIQSLTQRVDKSNPTAVWTTLLASGAADECPGSGDPTRPGIAPSPAQAPVSFDPSRKAYYTWCFHNNALDSNYVLSTGDDADDDNVIVIESVGVTGGDGRAS